MDIGGWFLWYFVSQGQYEDCIEFETNVSLLFLFWFYSFWSGWFEQFIFNLTANCFTSTGGYLFSSHASCFTQSRYSFTRFFEVWDVCSQGLCRSCFSHSKHQVTLITLYLFSQFMWLLYLGYKETLVFF